MIFSDSDSDIGSGLERETNQQKGGFCAELMEEALQIGKGWIIQYTMLSNLVNPLEENWIPASSESHKSTPGKLKTYM